LDEGNATTGARVTSHYDPLLAKVTANALDLYAASRKMHRSLREFRIRGVKTNIPLLLNIVSSKELQEGSYTTKFLDESPELFRFPPTKDRATKILRFLADVTVNDPHELPSKIRSGEKDSVPLISNR